MELSNRDKSYIQTRLIRITDAKEEICTRIKEKSSCINCPLNEMDRCNDLNLPPLNKETMKLEETD